MKVCLNCGDNIDINHNYCEDCAYIRLKKYIEELYKKQVQEEKRIKSIQ